MRPLTILNVITLATAVLLSGCDGNESAWKDAQELNTIEAYSAYQKAYPQSPYIATADERIRFLEKAIKDKLFENFNASLVPFVNNENISTIAELCGNSSNNVALHTAGRDVSWSVLSGKFQIIGGAMVPISGSKVVVSIFDDRCEITAMVSDPGKISKVERTRFKAGADIKFSGGEHYIYDGSEWEQAR